VMGVRYVIAHRSSIPWPLRARPPVFEDAEVAVYDRPSALPRAFLVSGATFAASPAEALRRMTRSDFDPLRELVVEDRVAAAWTGSPTSPVGRVEILQYDPEAVFVLVVADRPSFLLLSDTYYPGWRAFLDGEERPIYRADYLFRALPLPAGKHTVEFIFDPPAVKAGMGVSAASLLAVGLGLAATFSSVRCRAKRAILVLARRRRPSDDAKLPIERPGDEAQAARQGLPPAPEAPG
jgi:hypothetical protein